MSDLHGLLSRRTSLLWLTEVPPFELGGRVASALTALPAAKPAASADPASPEPRLQSALELLASLLTPTPESPKNVTLSSEVKRNICALLTAAGRGVSAPDEKRAFRAVLERWSVDGVDKGAEGLEEMRALGLRVLE